MQSLQRLCSFSQSGNFISMKCRISKAVVLGFSGTGTCASESDEGLSRLLEASGSSGVSPRSSIPSRSNSSPLEIGSSWPVETYFDCQQVSRPVKGRKLTFGPARGEATGRVFELRGLVLGRERSTASGAATEEDAVGCFALQDGHQAMSKELVGKKRENLAFTCEGRMSSRLTRLGPVARHKDC